MNDIISTTDDVKIESSSFMEVVPTEMALADDFEDFAYYVKHCYRCHPEAFVYAKVCQTMDPSLPGSRVASLGIKPGEYIDRGEPVLKLPRI